ncbi:hypothetical protein, partial [Plasmodium yoelii yoelii]
MHYRCILLHGTHLSSHSGTDRGEIHDPRFSSRIDQQFLAGLEAAVGRQAIPAGQDGFGNADTLGDDSERFPLLHHDGLGRHQLRSLQTGGHRLGVFQRQHQAVFALRRGSGRPAALPTSAGRIPASISTRARTGGEYFRHVTPGLGRQGQTPEIGTPASRPVVRDRLLDRPLPCVVSGQGQQPVALETVVQMLQISQGGTGGNMYVIAAIVVRRHLHTEALPRGGNQLPKTGGRFRRKRARIAGALYQGHQHQIQRQSPALDLADQIMQKRLRPFGQTANPRRPGPETRHFRLHRWMVPAGQFQTLPEVMPQTVLVV